MGLRLKKRLLAAIEWVWRDDEGGGCSIANNHQAVCQPKSDGLNADNLTLRVFPGRGGIAIETYRYDRKSGDGTTVLHIVQEGESLADSLAQIITLDSMRM